MNTNSICSVGGPAAPKSEIGGILDKLVQNLAMARNKVGSLEGTISEVLCPGAADTGTYKEEPPASCALAQHLQHANSEVEALVCHLNHLIDRVQL